MRGLATGRRAPAWLSELESEIARSPGKDAALFLPTGTMAEPGALRVNADRRGQRCELAVGDATLAVSTAEMRGLFEGLSSRN